jgi:YD repeat-containing protein
LHKWADESVVPDKGNLLCQTHSDGSTDNYTYTPRGWIATQTRKQKATEVTKQYTVTNTYDLCGNRERVTDPMGNITTKEYDYLNRIIRMTKPAGGEEQYGYDEEGNRIFVIDGNGNQTTTTYNNYNRVTKIQSPLTTDSNPLVRYFYDRLGNKTKETNNLGHTRLYSYDNLNRLTDETDEIGGVCHYSYDKMGNVDGTIDPNGTVGVYGYKDNYLLNTITLTNAALNQTKTIAYEYDEEGNLKRTTDDGVEVKYNYSDAGTYQPDAYKRIFSKRVNAGSNELVTRYTYDKGERVTSITYPNKRTVSYTYNTLGELTAMPGYLKEAPLYNGNGILERLVASNNIAATFGYDMDNRLTNMTYGSIKQYDFTYDNANNIIMRNEDIFNYDEENRLIRADLEGTFGTNTNKIPKPVYTVHEDMFGIKQLDQAVQGTELLELDYNAGSIGVDLGSSYEITKIELYPAAPTNRVAPEAIRVFTSESNYVGSYTERTNTQKAYVEKDGKTVLEIRLTSPVMTQYVKIKTNYDDRNLQFQARNKAEFKAKAEDIIKVYYNTETRNEIYSLDTLGNRTGENITTESEGENTYRYYPNCSRLMTDGKYVYQYNANGNTVKKGTMLK